MCDFSLHANPNRLAREGEQLVVHRFPTHSMGLASPAEVDTVEQEHIFPRSWSWRGVKEWFKAQGAPARKVTAVCIPPGARLMVHDIPENIQQEFGVRPTEEVVFVELTSEAFTYRDGVRFGNGRQVLLQRLRAGQRVQVLRLGSSEDAPRPEETIEPAWISR